MRRRLNRLNDRDWRVLDRVLAGVFLVAVLAEMAVEHKRGSLVLNLVVVALMALSLVWRRERPLITAAVVAAGGTLLLTLLTLPQDVSSVVFLVITT